MSVCVCVYVCVNVNAFVWKFDGIPHIGSGPQTISFLFKYVFNDFALGYMYIKG